MTDDHLEENFGDRETFPDVHERLIAFVRTLRADGASVPADASVAAARALSVVGLSDRRQVRAALAASLVSQRADLEIFEQHFPTFWYGLRRDLESENGTDESHREEQSETDDLVSENNGDTRKEQSETENELSDWGGESFTASDEMGDRKQATYSPSGEGNFLNEPGIGTAEIDDRDFRAFASALEEVAGRRFEDKLGRQPNVRRALRRSVTTGGAIAKIPYRRRAVSEFSCCVLVDVSRSVLDTIDRRFLLSLLDRLHRESKGTRIFFFDTELQEVTHVFERTAGDPLAALRNAELSWGGGTRIGESIATFRRNYPDAVGPDTIVLVISDGFDVGELDQLEDGMAWLNRRGAGVLWLNPLAGTDSYEPTCRGMSRALPFVDGLFPFVESADIAEIGRQVGRRGLHGRIGYEYDAGAATR
jgi:uncharacterized protein